jgi:hypothetical protein
MTAPIEPIIHDVNVTEQTPVTDATAAITGVYATGAVNI